MRSLIALLILVAAQAVTAAPAPTADQPRVEGSLEVNPQTGLFGGSLCVRGVGPVRSFLLTRGFNVREVRDGASNQVYGFTAGFADNADGDALTYTLDDNVSLNGVCVDYVGAYPVYHVDGGEHAVDDWKGQIAFDGHTVRASEQTRFYPVVLEPSGEQINQLAYDIEVRCATCHAIYMNGAEPVRGQRAHFVSSVRRPLLLYAGDFPISSYGVTYFIGADASPAAAQALGSGLAAIAAAHQAYLGLPVEDHPVMLSFAAVSRSHPLGRNMWGFATWPTIASDGRVSFDVLARATVNGRLAPAQEHYLAHEMAHYYFGERYSPRGKLRWFMLESTAEYLSAVAVRRLQGQAAYDALLRNYAANGLMNVKALNQISIPDNIGENYRYEVGPLLWAAMANALGEPVVQHTLADFVRNPPNEDVDYALLRRRLVAAGASEPNLQRFEAACLQAPVPPGCLELAGVPLNSAPPGR